MTDPIGDTLRGLRIKLPWYGGLEDAIEPYWGWMVLLVLAAIALSLYLIYLHDPVLMAAWVVYLLLP